MSFTASTAVAPIIFVVSYALIEYIYMSFAKPTYINHFGKITHKSYGEIQKHLALQGKQILVVLATYTILFAGVWVFVVSDIIKYKRVDGKVFAKGIMFALSVYGIYNLTNMATLPGYEWYIVIMDTLWGLFSMCLIIIIMYTFVSLQNVNSQ